MQIIFDVRGWEMSQTQLEWITIGTADAPLRSYSLVASPWNIGDCFAIAAVCKGILHKIELVKMKRKTCRIWIWIWIWLYLLIMKSNKMVALFHASYACDWDSCIIKSRQHFGYPDKLNNSFSFREFCFKKT